MVSSLSPTALRSQITEESPAYRENRHAMLALLSEVRVLEARVRASSDRAAARFEKRGQLLPHKRVAALLDPATPFLPLSTLAGLGMHDDDGKENVSGGSTIIGIGLVCEMRCLVIAHDAAIKGGTISPLGLKKTLRAQEIAQQNRLPVIMLVESGGANLNYQSELFVEGGRVFCNMARLSAAGIPQITIVHGSSTAGGAYIPGLSDYVIAVKDRARIFLAGPPLVAAALGEQADEESLGGAAMHAETSGTAEYLAEDDAHAIAIARNLVDKLTWPRAPRRPPSPQPCYDAEQLCGVFPADPRQPADLREVIARVVDLSEFLEIKARFGADTLCGHAAIEGHKVGIVANNGPITPNGSVKAAQFIQLCCQSQTPIVYLMNTTGYMVGTAAEQAGAIKHGAKMIQAVANANVPQLTVVVGGAYGAGYYGMCGRAFDPRFIFSWPSAKVAVMGGEQAATVMQIITRAKLARQGKTLDENALSQMSAGLKKQLDQQASALFATARLWDDGIIDPRDTRAVLALCLDVCKEAETRSLNPSSFGVARG
jgi:geranyl-CoA carboxylase beta subunit